MTPGRNSLWIMCPIYQPNLSRIMSTSHIYLHLYMDLKSRVKKSFFGDLVSLFKNVSRKFGDILTIVRNKAMIVLGHTGMRDPLDISSIECFIQE
jgi:hypothetical protein